MSSIHSNFSAQNLLLAWTARPSSSSPQEAYAKRKTRFRVIKLLNNMGILSLRGVRYLLKIDFFDFSNRIKNRLQSSSISITERSQLKEAYEKLSLKKWKVVKKDRAYSKRKFHERAYQTYKAVMGVADPKLEPQLPESKPANSESSGLASISPPQPSLPPIHSAPISDEADKPTDGADKPTESKSTITTTSVLTAEQSIESILDNWIKEEKNDSLKLVIKEEKIDNLKLVKMRIIDFLKDKNSNNLDLKGLWLKNLPNVFHLSPINTKLKYLNLDCNYLENFPSEFSELKALNKLSLDYNRFEELPLAICNLKNLESLNLINCTLRELPPEIGQLTLLKELYLAGSFFREGPHNHLVTLPTEIESLTKLKKLVLSYNNFGELPLAICNLKNLESLNLTNCKLRELPPEIGQLTSLKELWLGGGYVGRDGCNLLTTLPPEIKNLTQLEVLDLSWNLFERLPNQICQLSLLRELDLSQNRQLQELPREIGQLRSLKKLDLKGTSLRGLPEEILQLPQGCIVELPTSLSNAVLGRLRAATQQPGYSGPSFSYSIQEEPEEQRTIEELLERLFTIAGTTPVEFTELRKDPEKAEKLRSWLSKLSWAADFKKEGEFQKGFVNKILGYLTLAENDPKFRETFFLFIEDASTTCGDRVSLSVLHLGIQFKLATMDISDMKNVADFLAKGVWAISLLEDVARYKVSTLQFFDEIEVYLGYPIKLREKLGLPIDVEDMLYFTCSALTQEDLDTAEEYIKDKLGNKDELYEFLIDQPTWKKSLEANFGSRMAALERTKAAAQQVESPDYTAIDQEYKKGLLELTKEALLICA